MPVSSRVPFPAPHSAMPVATRYHPNCSQCPPRRPAVPSAAPHCAFHTAPAALGGAFNITVITMDSHVPKSTLLSQPRTPGHDHAQPLLHDPSQQSTLLSQLKLLLLSACWQLASFPAAWGATCAPSACEECPAGQASTGRTRVPPRARMPACVPCCRLEAAPPPPLRTCPHGCSHTCVLAVCCRLEATYAIREDLADALGRVGAYWDDSGDMPVVGDRLLHEAGLCHVCATARSRGKEAPRRPQRMAARASARACARATACRTRIHARARAQASGLKSGCCAACRSSLRAGHGWRCR